MITCDLYVNETTTDAARDGSWVKVESGDFLLWSDGSSDVADGKPIPIEAQLNIAATLLDVLAHEVSYCFLLDATTGLCEKIPNAGSQAKRYVFCFAFSGATATEPTLEAWDDTDHDTNNDYCLGEGTGTNSWLLGVLTTNGTPPSSWVGTPISGNGVSSSILLNGGSGALTGAKDVYVNLKVLIPGGVTTPSSEQPPLTVRYCWN